MCGILGITEPVNDIFFLNNLDKISYRGPDGYGVWQTRDKTVTLGHRRLAILDLSNTGKQPLHYEHLTITFNGEIYNFLEIRNELKRHGYRFLSESDTEVILAAYLHWGTDCFHKFNGMWALGIWDDKNKELILSRDRFGKKPLFYSQLAEGVVFSSEMKAIAPFLESVTISKDFHWCKNNKFLYEATDKCLIEGIKRFPAGHYAKVKLKENKVVLTRFWNTIDEIQPTQLSYEAQVEQFRELLIDACKIRMRSDVPIGTLLSGGLDSSAVFSLMAHIGKTLPNDQRESHDWQHAFTASFPGTYLDETHYAKQVTNHYLLPLEEVNINQLNTIEKLEEYSTLFEELYGNNPIPMIETYKAVRKKGIIVTLDGHGADEYLGGYASSAFEAFFDAPSQVQMIFDTYQGMMAQGGKGHLPLEVFKFLASRIKANSLALLQNTPLIGKDQQIPIPSAPRLEKMDAFTSHLYSIFHDSLLPTLLRNFDRYSMIASMETRMPLMDHRLITFAFSLPWMSKLRNGYSKALLRDATKPYMPLSVNTRKPKLGFSSPVAHWMKNEWKGYLLDTVHSQEFKECSLIESALLKKRIESILSTKNTPHSQGQDVWHYFSTFLWYKTFYKSLKKEMPR